MNKFFDKTGRFFMNLLIICLVLLISYQIIIKTDTANPALREFNKSIQKYLGQERESDSIPVLEERLTGVIIIDLMQDYSLPEVWVLKNGQRTANFSSGIVRIEVKNGDFISIDARNYGGTLWFELTSITDNVSNLTEGKQFRISGNLLELGIVDIYNRL